MDDQYFRAVFLSRTNERFGVTSPHEASTLRQQARNRTAIVRRAENLLRPGGRCYGMRVVWAGDYADEEPGQTYNLYAAPDVCNLDHEGECPSALRYIVNHTQATYVDLAQYGLGHPLPLLTVEGVADDPTYEAWVGAWARDEITCENMAPPPHYSPLVLRALRDE